METKGKKDSRRSKGSNDTNRANQMRASDNTFGFGVSKFNGDLRKSNFNGIIEVKCMPEKILPKD